MSLFFFVFGCHYGMKERSCRLFSSLLSSELDYRDEREWGLSYQSWKWYFPQACWVFHSSYTRVKTFSETIAAIVDIMMIRAFSTALKHWWKSTVLCVFSPPLGFFVTGTLQNVDVCPQNSCKHEYICNSNISQTLSSHHQLTWWWESPCCQQLLPRGASLGKPSDIHSLVLRLTEWGEENTLHSEGFDILVIRNTSSSPVCNCTENNGVLSTTCHTIYTPG